MKSLIVEVTERDIKNGIREDATSCAIARAVKRATGRRDVEVCENYIDIPKDDYTLRDVTKTVQSFIKAYDAGEEVKPFSFALRGYKKVEA